MLIPALVAFAHFLAFFALAAALVLELALLIESPGVEVARRIQRADLVVGMAALLLLVAGFLRVIYFEKGGDYYFANTFFQIKLALFIIAGVISLYPSALFRRWNSELKQGIPPELDADTVRRLKKIIHWELVLIGGMLICASLMAKGFGI
jgi:putative membrane protein